MSGSLQRRFAAIVESIDQQKSRLRAHPAKLDTLFAALQDRAFRGVMSGQSGQRGLTRAQKDAPDAAPVSQSFGICRQRPFQTK